MSEINHEITKGIILRALEKALKEDLSEIPEKDKNILRVDALGTVSFVVSVKLEDVVSVKDAALSLGASPTAILQAIQAGRMKAAKFGRCLGITPKEVERYRKESLRPPRIPKPPASCRTCTHFEKDCEQINPDESCSWYILKKVSP